MLCSLYLLLIKIQKLYIDNIVVEVHFVLRQITVVGIREKCAVRNFLSSLSLARFHLTILFKYRQTILEEYFYIIGTIGIVVRQNYL